MRLTEGSLQTVCTNICMKCVFFWLLTHMSKYIFGGQKCLTELYMNMGFGFLLSGFFGINIYRRYTMQHQEDNIEFIYLIKGWQKPKFWISCHRHRNT